MAKYNLKERKERNAAYRSMVRAEVVEDLYEKILRELVANKKYKDPNYSAKKLAEDLNTNTRYISAVVNIRFRKNYSSVVNEYRIKDAQYLLADKHYKDRTMAEISTMVGFSNRQSFYASFYRFVGTTPRVYRVTAQAAMRKQEEDPK